MNTVEILGGIVKELETLDDETLLTIFGIIGSEDFIVVGLHSGNVIKVNDQYVLADEKTS